MDKHSMCSFFFKRFSQQMNHQWDPLDDPPTDKPLRWRPYSGRLPIGTGKAEEMRQQAGVEGGELRVCLQLKVPKTCKIFGYKVWTTFESFSFLLAFTRNMSCFPKIVICKACFYSRPWLILRFQQMVFGATRKNAIGNQYPCLGKSAIKLQATHLGCCLEPLYP